MSQCFPTSFHREREASARTCNRVPPLLSEFLAKSCYKGQTMQVKLESAYSLSVGCPMYQTNFRPAHQRLPFSCSTSTKNVQISEKKTSFSPRTSQLQALHFAFQAQPSTSFSNNHSSATVCSNRRRAASLQAPLCFLAYAPSIQREPIRCLKDSHVLWACKATHHLLNISGQPVSRCITHKA